MATFESVVYFFAGSLLLLVHFTYYSKTASLFRISSEYYCDMVAMLENSAFSLCEDSSTSQRISV